MLTDELVERLKCGRALPGIVAAQQQLQQDANHWSSSDGCARIRPHNVPRAAAHADAKRAAGLAAGVGAEELQQRLAHGGREREHQKRIRHRRPEAGQRLLALRPCPGSQTSACIGAATYESSH